MAARDDLAHEDTTVKQARGQGEVASRKAGGRERILAAASQVIARQGIKGLRFEDVAARANVSRALLYYHFGNRTGLVNAAFEYTSEQAPSTILRTTSEDRNGFDSLVDGLLAELTEDRAVRDHAVAGRLLPRPCSRKSCGRRCAGSRAGGRRRRNRR